MSSRTLTGAWIETTWNNAKRYQKSRTLTGAWIETTATTLRALYTRVAPSRVRGLKPHTARYRVEMLESHPHGCVD